MVVFVCLFCIRCYLDGALRAATLFSLAPAVTRVGRRATSGCRCSACLSFPQDKLAGEGGWEREREGGERERERVRGVRERAIRTLEALKIQPLLSFYAGDLKQQTTKQERVD